MGVYWNYRAVFEHFKIIGCFVTRRAPTFFFSLRRKFVVCSAQLQSVISRTYLMYYITPACIRLFSNRSAAVKLTYINTMCASFAVRFVVLRVFIVR